VARSAEIREHGLSDEQAFYFRTFAQGIELCQKPEFVISGLSC
jgi:hypothetical protein